jgi:hypothetical protein
MNKVIRVAVVALNSLCLVGATAALIGTVATAQIKQVGSPSQPPPTQFFAVKQLPLTEQMIQGVLAATESIQEITDNVPEDIDKLSAATVAKLDVVARKHGLASYDEYKAVNENIGLVSAGLDPVTNKYIGREAVIRVQISRVRADKKMSAADKKEKLDDLNDQLQFALPPLQYKANIDLVAKYSDALAKTMRGD